MRLHLFLLGLLFSGSVFATPYKWSTSNSAVYGYHSTPLASCTAFVNISSKPVGTYGENRRNPSVTYQKVNQFKCNYEYLPTYSDGSYNNTYYNASATTTREGTECENSEAVYNSQTGTCVAPEPSLCESKQGQSTGFSLSGTGSTSYMYISPDGKFNAPSQSACFSGCSASTVDQKCKSSSVGFWFCGGTAVFDGGECGEGTDAETLPGGEVTDAPEKPEPSIQKDTQPCNYVTTPDGDQTCTSVQDEQKDGQTCGTFNGETLCPTIQPERDKTQIDTTVSTETNPDGTTTTTKTDTATKTVCTGTSCNTTITTTTTTTNSNGTTSSSCTGPQCPTSGNPDGNGDGLGDCVGNCVGEEILTGEFPENEEVGSFGDSVQGYMDRIGDSPIATAIDGVSFPTGGSCSFPSVSVVYLGTISFDSICQNTDWLNPLYFVFLGIWAFVAVRVLMSA